MTKVQIKSYKLVPFLSFLFTSFLYCSSEYTKKRHLLSEKGKWRFIQYHGVTTASYRSYHRNDIFSQAITTANKPNK